MNKHTKKIIKRGIYLANDWGTSVGTELLESQLNALSTWSQNLTDTKLEKIYEAVKNIETLIPHDIAVVVHTMAQNDEFTDESNCCFA